MHRGYIKLSRNMIDWEWASDANVVALFIHLLLMANYKETQFKGFKLNPGDLVASLLSLSKKTGLSVQQIRTCLSKLKSTNEITIETNMQFSIISITKWDEYQCDQQTIQQTDNKRSTQSKEYKEYKEYKYIYPQPIDVSETTWADFQKLRKEKKAPITETAMNGIRREAEKAGWTLEQALVEVCQRNWQGFKAEWVGVKVKPTEYQGLFG